MISRALSLPSSEEDDEIVSEPAAAPKPLQQQNSVEGSPILATISEEIIETVGEDVIRESSCEDEEAQISRFRAAARRARRLSQLRVDSTSCATSKSDSDPSSALQRRRSVPTVMVRTLTEPSPIASALTSPIASPAQSPPRSRTGSFLYNGRSVGGGGGEEIPFVSENPLRAIPSGPATYMAHFVSPKSISPVVRVWPGKSYPLGATWDGRGVNFALFSENATKVELCLFSDSEADIEEIRIEMPEYTDHVWHCYLPDIRPGRLYGYRVYGPWEPERGMRFNPNKVLLDPYAKAIGRAVKWHPSMYAYKMGESDLTFDERDNAAYCPLALVIDTAFTWGSDHPPDTPWHKTVIYETHIKSLTALHPEIPPELRGSYAAVCFEPVIRHLKAMGVTAIEFMPLHSHLSPQILTDQGLCDYWGYNTLSFFAPHAEYSHTADPMQAVQEFKTMVRVLHAHGIEVILDVVYNHTPEGNEMGPHLHLKGIDNASYYKATPENPRYFYDYTGCGNTLNVRHPRVLQLIMDSLRYWIQEMHVDGFRFDLAAALARTFFDVDRLAAFFDIIHQDPVISKVKLIAEPWDIGSGGYQVGNFPVLWTEWNGRYRDGIRAFWNGKGVTLTELASRIAGSPDLYSWSGRLPHASVNFVTCHDGFTLVDLVSYNDKHNEANRENNRDGNDNNLSWNCGVEGDASDSGVLELRWRQRANMFATMFLSLGVPMISGGDELSLTKRGNNNTYCQDNELNYYDWETIERDEYANQFLEFVHRVVALRHKHAVLRRRKFFTGFIAERGVKEIEWFNPSGAFPSNEEWHSPSCQCIGWVLHGSAINEMTKDGKRVIGDTLCVLINAQFHEVQFTLPEHFSGRPWTLVLHTSRQAQPLLGTKYEGNGKFAMKDHSLALFELSSIPQPSIDAVETA